MIRKIKGMEFEAPNHRRRATWIAVTVAAMLLIVYPLSLGPYSWLAMNGYLSHNFGRIFYFPISFLAQQSDTVRSVFTEYVRWWTF